MKYKDHLIVGGLIVLAVGGIGTLAVRQNRQQHQRTAIRDLSKLSAGNKPTTTTEPPTTTTMPPTTTTPPTVNLDPVGEAPIQRLSVDLADTRDHVAPSVGVPDIACARDSATVRVRAEDNTGVNRVTGVHTSVADQDGGSRTEEVRFIRVGADWEATFSLAGASSHTLAVTASDGNNNTRSRTATNLCS